MPDNSSKIALVTGSSSGLGLALANALRQRHYRVIGLGRRKPENVEDRDFIVCDLSQPGAVESALQALRERTDRLDLLVNNAGFGGYATWEELPETELRRMFEVDFFAPVALTRAMLELLKASHGSIINLSSIAALAPVPCMGAYSAVKAALLQCSLTLHAELKHDGIKVLTVCPGRISTGFSSRAIRLRACPDTPGNHVDPARFAEKVLRSLERNRRIVIYPGWYGLFVWFTRHLPNLYETLALKTWKL